jgi:hypothetical protein
MDIFKRFRKQVIKGGKCPSDLFRDDLQKCEVTDSVCAFHDTGVILPNYKYSDKAICHACVFSHLSEEINILLKDRR